MEAVQPPERDLHRRGRHDLRRGFRELGAEQPGAGRRGIRVGSARDGSVSYFIEDIESTTIEHSGAEAVGVDSEGNVYGGVVRRRMLEKHVPVR